MKKRSCFVSWFDESAVLILLFFVARRCVARSFFDEHKFPLKIWHVHKDYLIQRQSTLKCTFNTCLWAASFVLYSWITAPRWHSQLLQIECCHRTAHEIIVFSDNLCTWKNCLDIFISYIIINKFKTSALLCNIFFHG